MKIKQHSIAALEFVCLVMYTYANDFNIAISDNVAAIEYTTNKNQDSSIHFMTKETNKQVTATCVKCSLSFSDDNRTLASTTNMQTWKAMDSVVTMSDKAGTLKIQSKYGTRNSRIEVTTVALRPLKVLSTQDACAAFGTCNRILEEQIPYEFQHCRCDIACSIFNDCCLDSEFISGTEKRPFVCAPLYKIPYTSTDMFRGIYLIDSCPENLNNTELRSKCYQQLTEAGPYVSIADGTVYKNRFCASCNGINDFAIFSIKVTPLIDINGSYSNIASSQLLQSFLSDPFLAYELVPPLNLEWRPCIYTEPVNSNISECINYIVNPVVVIGSLKVYRNYFCEHSDWFLCFIPYYLRFKSQEVYPLSVIFSFSTTNGGGCLQGQEKKNGICQDLPLFVNYTVQLTFRLKTASKVEPTFLKQILISLLFSLSVPNVSILRCACFNDTRSPQNSTFVVSVDLKLTKAMSEKETLFLKKKIQHSSWKSIVKEITTMNTIELFSELLTEDEVIGKIILWEYPSEEQINDVMNLLRVQLYENMSLTFCTDIVVHSFLSNQTLTIQKIECYDIGMFGNQYGARNLIKSVITYVGSCLSVIALLVSVTVSRKLKLTNSIPGNNIENLSLSLIISSVLFMAGVGTQDYQIVCYVIGIALHYLWLVSFSFMSIAVVYVVQNLRKMVANVSHALVSSRKCSYTALGLVLPILFVLPSVLLDYFDAENFSAMYTGLICFPTGYLPNIMFVTGPIVISTIVNLIFLIVIIAYVTRHNMKMNHIRKSHSFQQGKIYLRICSIAGVFWLTGVLGVILNSELMDYIFLILCSLQGFAIAVGNLSTRRVLSGFQNNPKQYRNNT